jgi:amino acid transporter
VITFAVLAAIPFIILAVAIIFQGGAGGNTVRALLPVSGWGAALYGVLYAVLLFVGFEAAASISEEMHSPKSHIPIAVLLTIAVGTVFYTLMGYAAAIGFGEQAVDAGVWQNTANPFHDLAIQYVGGWLGQVIDLAIILDMLSLALAFMVTTARGVFALSRDGLLPRTLVAVSRHHTPLAGNLVVVGWSIFLLVLSWLWDWQGANHLPPIMQWFSITATTGAFLVELIYLLLAVAAVRLIARRHRSGFPVLWRSAIVLIGAMVPILAFRGALWPFPAYPDSLGAWLALASILVVGVWYTVLRVTRPEAIQRAALHATEL